MGSLSPLAKALTRHHSHPHAPPLQEFQILKVANSKGLEFGTTHC